jgi:hypothetical protein
MLDKAGGASPLEQAVFSFQDKLQKAARLEGRPAAIEALQAIVEFLSAISGPGELQHQWPVNSLVSALISLDDGRAVPLLRPAKIGHRAINSVAMEGAKATAVFIAMRLIGMGLDPDVADEKVAVVCRKAGILPGRSGATHQRLEVTARTVRGWREVIEEDVGKHSRAGRHFALLSGASQHLKGTTMPDDLLERLRRYLTNLHVM